MDNQKFNKVFRVAYITLLLVALLATVWYWIAASGKDCLACSLPVCETVDENGETSLLPADECAQPYADILEREAAQGIDIEECSQECINYSGAYLTFAIILIVLAIVFWIFGGVYSAFSNSKKKSITALVVVAFVVIAALIAFLMSSDVVPEILGFDGEISLFDVKLTDTMLYATYFLLGGAVVAILSSFVIKFIRK